VFLAHFAAAQFTVSGFLKTTNGDLMRDFAVVVSGSENQIVYTDAPQINIRWCTATQGYSPPKTHESKLNSIFFLKSKVVRSHGLH
jgi:hypothetical protein